MAAQLTFNQMRRALTALGALSELGELSDFPASAARVVRELIACEHSGYNAIDPASGRAVVVADPPDVVFDGGPELLAQLAHQNPIITRAAAGDRSVLRLSDFVSRREFHGTQLYSDVYQRIGLEYQLGLQLRPVGGARDRPGTVVGVSLARHRTDFDDEDRLLLELLGSTLAATLERLHQRELLRSLTSVTDSDVAQWILLVDADGVLAWATPAAEAALGVTVGDQADIDRDRFDVRTVPDPRLLYQPWQVTPRRAPDPVVLRRLGLSQRQAEVLALAATGLGTRQIADELFISRRTVETHFQAIYDRLGVRTRAQAVAAVLTGAA